MRKIVRTMTAAFIPLPLLRSGLGRHHHRRCRPDRRARMRPTASSTGRASKRPWTNQRRQAACSARSWLSSSGTMSRTQTRCFGRQQVRCRRDEVRRRTLQFGRHNSGVGSLRRKWHPVRHADGDQPDGHRARPLERVSCLRTGRPAGHRRREIHPRENTRTRKSRSSTTSRPPAKASQTRCRRHSAQGAERRSCRSRSIPAKRIFGARRQDQTIGRRHPLLRRIAYRSGIDRSADA